MIRHDLPAYLHWPPTGNLAAEVMGESFHRDAIESIAKNPQGKPALVYCTALLMPEPTNPHDSNAIKVVIEGETVGYLPRDYVDDYRARFRRHGLDVQSATCDAVITDGLVDQDQRLNYSIWLHWRRNLAPQHG